MSTLGDRVREAAATLEEFDAYYDQHGTEDRSDLEGWNEYLEGWSEDLADALRAVIKAWETN